VETNRILLVDDEVSLLALMQKYLARLGYLVDTCERAQRAWELFTEEGRRYALVIVDLSLPDLPGEVLLRRMLERDRDVRALICSGAPDSGAGFAADAARVGFLQKPFLPKMLADAVKNILGPGSASAL